MKFFFDRCMSVRIARMMDAYDALHQVRHLDDDVRFQPETPDTEWIATLAADDPTWIVLSGDGRILRNKVERATLQTAGLTFFCMATPWTHMKFSEYA